LISPNPQQLPVLPAEYLEPRWYAAYTHPRHEKRVAEQLGQREVECFLPLYDSLRRWKDRRKLVQLPLFPGYVFVCIALKDRLRVLEIPSVVHLVRFNGHPAPLPQEEIEALRAGLAGGACAEPHPYLTVGRRVRLKSGPLAGLTGILLRRKGKFRVVISIEVIQRSVAVQIDARELEPI